MISSTLIQGLSANNLSSGFSFGKAGAGRSDGFAQLLGHLTSSGENAGVTGDSGTLLTGGKSVLNQLKKAFMDSGRSLEDYTADDGAVDEFASILVKLGFNSGEVEEMMSNFGSRSVENDVTLADLFSAASQLSEPDAAVMLDVAAFPDLESILTGLGLDLKTSRDIISDALVGGVGIDLGQLAAGIRQAIGDMGAESETVIGSPSEVLEKMQRLGLIGEDGASLQTTLEALISQMSRSGDALETQGAASESGGTGDGLLLSYLEKLSGSHGSRNSDLQWLMASAGKENGGLDDRTLLSGLVQMKQAAASTASGAGMQETGDISLERFAAILENRVAGAGGRSGPAKGATAGRSLPEMVNGLMEKVTTSAGDTSERAVMPVALEGKKPFQKSWEPGGRRFSNSEGSRNAVASASETAGKEADGQNTFQASRLSGSAAEAQQQMGGKISAASTTDSAGASDILNAAGRDETRSTLEDPRIGTEGLIREMKAGNEAASLGKTASGRNLPGYLLEQVSRQIIRLRNAGENEMSLQLKPPHLGRMKLNVEHTSGGIKVGIVVESAAARDMLLSNSHDLKTALADQGLRLDKIDVEAQADFGQSMAQAGRGFDQSGGRKGRWGQQGRQEDGDISENPVAAGSDTGEGGSGRLDLVA